MSAEKKPSSETLRTTDTMKQKGKCVSRIVILFLKMFRVCGRNTKKHKTVAGSA